MPEAVDFEEKPEYDTQLLGRVLANFTELIKRYSDYSGSESTFTQKRYFYSSLHSCLYAIYAELELLSNSLSFEKIQELLNTFQGIVRDSYFVKRCQDIPLGYAGDYITIHQVLQLKNFAEKNTLGFLIEKHILNSPILQQHRNKINYEVSLILNTILEKDNPKIMCFSVGDCYQLRRIFNQLKGKRFTLFLHDTNSSALELAKENLDPIIENCEFYAGNFFRLIKKDIIEHKFDLITMGGIMDYVSDKAFAALLKPLYNKLIDGGKIYITQLSRANSYTSFMRCVLMWDVIQRTKEEIVEILDLAEIPQTNMNIFRESTEITYLVEISKIAPIHIV